MLLNVLKSAQLTKEGETIEEALANLKEATRLYLEKYSFLDTDTSPRFVTTIEVSYA